MMTQRTYTDEYFKNQTEQAKIKQALTAAIPRGVTYYNLVMSLTQLLQEWMRLAFQDEVQHYDPNQDVKP
jgi:hypothetical protein